MKNKKIILITLMLIAIFITIGTTKSEAKETIKPMTNNKNEVNYEVIEQNATESTKTDNTWYNKINRAGGWGIYETNLAEANSLYCVAFGSNFYDAAKYKITKEYKGIWKDKVDPASAWIYASGLGNSGNKSNWKDLPAQNAVWTLQGENRGVTGTVLEKVNEAKAYRKYMEERYALKNEKKYNYPEMDKSKKPESKNGLVGPFKVDYMYGEENGTIVAGMDEMILKDEKGNIVQHSTKDLGKKSRWYIADKNGKPLDNGSYGNKPKPNQEFYIKVVNYKSSKGYVTFKIQKIEVYTEYYLCERKC